MDASRLPDEAKIAAAERTLMQGDPGHPDSVSRFEIIEAANYLMQACAHSRQPGLEPMLRCLEYGGVVAEFGARCLYVCTGRDGLGWSHSGGGWPFVVDREDWLAWLRRTCPRDLPPHLR